MRRTLTTFSLSASIIIALSSCSSDDGFANHTFEESLPSTELILDEGVTPPWATNFDDGTQVNANSHTPSYDGSNKPSDESSESTGMFGQKQSLANVDEDTVLERLDGNHFDVQYSNPNIEKTTKTKIKKRSAKRIKKPTVIVYKVKKGDNLSMIAYRSGTTVAAIRRASGIKGSLIYAGQTIRVPYTPRGYKATKSSSPYRGKTSTYTVRRGDSISVIAARYGTSTNAVLRANNMSKSQAKSIQIGQKIKIPASKRNSSSSSRNTSASSSGKSYIIKSGDTLSEIAGRHGVRTTALMKANNMTNNDARRLRPGQKIIIP